MDIMRHQQTVCADKVQPFLTLIQDLFEQMESVVHDQLDNPEPGAHGAVVSTPGNSQAFQNSPRPGSPVASVSDFGADPQQQTRPLLKGMASFKVLAECPIIVVSIFQVYRNSVSANVKIFVPLIKTVLLLQAKPQEQAHKDAEAKGTIHTGVSPNIRDRAAFGEFITAQVKTMSFLAYLLRVYAQQLTDFLPTLPDIVVRLLKDCPRERSAARKELLVAIRHIINFNFRKIFLKKIDELLDERTLIGDGLTVYETMRPLAYSMLADLIHHVRDALEPAQIRKTVEVYTKNLQANYPGTSFQTMSAKLLLNMAECIAKMPNKVDARHYLIMILNAIGDKFAAMNRQYPNAVKLSKLYEQQSIDATPDNYLADKANPPDWDEIDIFTAMPIKTSNPRDRGADPVADNKFLFKNLMNGLKNTFFQLKTCNGPSPVEAANAPQQWMDVTWGFSAEEVRVIIKLFREGAYVFRYYEIGNPIEGQSQYSSPVEYLANHYMVSSSKEEKELLETFATVFHCIDPATFHEVFHEEIPNLYKMIHEHTALLHVPQFFLASEATSPSFAGMLLKFLMDRIELVGSSDIQTSSILLRLFKLAFMAVTLFANTNEQVLLPHVLDIVTKSIELSTTAEEPMNYFLLLRSLFRSIGGGKFEHLYKQILPLLEMMLEVLNNLLLAARKPADRDLYVELCLTVPARLSNLLPHLSYLMRPLVVALRAGSELVGQGLRTLELCVDNLTADYLDPIMAPVIDELMTALFDHLRPTPYSHFHSHTTMRILGKLGGRNRKFMTNAPQLTFKQYSDDSTSFDLKLIGSKKDRAFPVEIGIELALSKLQEVPDLKIKLTPTQKKSDIYYKKQAMHMIKTQLKLRLGVDTLPENFGQMVRLQAQDLLASKTTADFTAFEGTCRERSMLKKEGQDVILKKLIKAGLHAMTLPDFAVEAKAMIVNICRHITILEVGRSLIEMRKRTQPFDVKAGEGPLCIDTKVLADAIAESLSSDMIVVREAAQFAIQEVYDTTAIIFGSESHIFRLSFFTYLSNTFCHGCYEEEWFTKAGGSLGINLLITKIDLGDVWVNERHLDFVRALLFVIKDMPADLPVNTRTGAQTTLDLLLHRCVKKANFSKDHLKPVAPPQRPSKIFSLCSIFATEIPHMNPHVRETSKRALDIIAKELELDVYDLLAPTRDRTLAPIYGKPLRALPFSTQIGFIDAITFYMGLKNNFVVFDEPLTRLLMESLALADAPDESLAGKPQEQRTHEMIISLRVACIKMLTIAMGFDEFQKGSASPTRIRIVSVFFKCLYSESKKTIEGANEALKVVLAQQAKLPKDLLQNGLRPVLAKLQDPSKLSVHGLDGLARLLQLLTTYFKVEIGARLLDHIRVLADPATLQRVSFTLIEQNEVMKVIAAVFNIFHLLPPAAEQFKERLIDTVLDLEDKLRRTRHSPFRAPLYNYLNKYPDQVWLLLLGKIEEQKYGRFLAQVLEDPESKPLRDVVSKNVESIIKTCGNMGDPDKDSRYAAVVNAINIMHAICLAGDEEENKWMENKEHLSWFKAVGKNLEQHLRTNSLPPTLRLAAEQAGDQLMVIFTKVLVRYPDDLDSLFGLVKAVTAENFKPSQALFSYIYQHIICSQSVDLWKTVVLRSLEIYASKAATQKTKSFLLHYLVNPIVAMDVMRISKQADSSSKTTRLIDKAVIESIHTKIWKVNIVDQNDDVTQPGIDHTRMEVLQLSAMLVKYYDSNLQDVRKDIIKFAWTYIRLEDVINKHAAYVVIGYFIAHYETPAKIVQQVYYTTLKASQNEGRALVTQALELIAPVLPKRCIAAPGDRNPVWAAAPRRILAEEGQNVQQMTSIFNFLVKHPDLFYDSRDKFAGVIIQNLRKIAQPPNPSNESKKLVLHLMTLIWQWEQKRVEGKDASPSRAFSESPNAKKRKLDALGEGHSPSATKSVAAVDKPEFQIPTPMRAKMIKYLVEFIASLTERCPLPSAKAKFFETTPQGALAPPPSVEMCKKAMALLYNLLQPQYWGDLDIDLFSNVTETVLASERTTNALASEHSDKDKPDEKFITNMINTLQIVRIIVNMKSDDWIVNNMSTLQHILEKSLKSDNSEIHDCLHVADETIDDGRQLKPLLARILGAIPDDTPMADADADGEPEASTSEVITFLTNIVTETLSASNYTSGLNTLWTLAQRKPSEIDQHIAQVIKALSGKLARDHVAHYTALSGHPGPKISTNVLGETLPQGVMNDYELSIQTNLMLKAIDVICMRMEVLGDSRRPFLSVLATVVEKSQSHLLCLKILDIVENWIFNSDGSWPTLKEKTAVLHKMLNFEFRPSDQETMLQKFLELVIRMYEDPKVTRTELTVRMEHAFLIGTRAQDVDMRNRFMAIFDKSQSKTASARLSYVITEQKWDQLADSFWLAQASELLFGAVDMTASLQLHAEDIKMMSVSTMFENYSKDTRTPSIAADVKFDNLIASEKRFVVELGDLKVRDVIEPLSQLQHLDPNVAHEIWVALFPLYWSATLREERAELERGMVALLTKDYHSRQVDKRPNVVQSLLDGAAKAWPACKIPPHVLKFEAKTYDAWYTALVQLEKAAIRPEMDSALVRESTLDALVELYANLQEDDLFYGTWRRRCQFVETNAALSYEQNGMWDMAQKMYEQAQIKARTGAIPFSQGEYMLWEDHWVLCAQKLQQWDILQEFAKHENFQDLLLECAWKNPEMWTVIEHRDQLDHIIKGVMDAPTPRRIFFQAFMSLLKLHAKTETQPEFNKVCDDAIQLSIRKWHQLPKRITNSHIPLLQNFQQLVELHDASVICNSLAQTNQGNLDTKSGELKLLLGTWRDRLPNLWDDISAWQDLVTWRQHIFNLINTTYLQLLPQQGAQNANGASFAYRGYHETAWIINRFAHVARKHQLPEVCISQLSRIYTLPNIEIQEAFLKLREQAKCHYANPSELSNGLDVINNTNLNYFGPNQKAEFYTLKGMFLEKLSQRDEAAEAYGMALFFDIKLPKAWAEWGYYNDRLFKENPTNYGYAKNALSCYLEAAGLYKSAKSRKLLTRILWLLSLDDSEGTLNAQFDEYKGETPVWYWITFIPQLLTGLGHKEASKAHMILARIAKSYPQALYFQLRTNREDMLAIKKSQEAKEERERKAKARNSQGATTSSTPKPNGSPSLQRQETPSGAASGSRPGTANPEVKTEQTEVNGAGTAPANVPATGTNGANASSGANGANGEQAVVVANQAPTKKPPWEHTEEILAVLKTAFPLLALSMESMVDQIQKYFKCPPDEDAYRLITALLNDALNYVGRMPNSYALDVKLPAATEANITRFAETILPNHIRKQFDADFVEKKPTMNEYIHKLRKWRDKFEEKLDRRRNFSHLENYSQHLSEFKFQKFDEVEVPGQYLQHKDKNQDFVRIERFLPNVELVRGIGVCHRRLKIRGHDGSVHPFAIQHPAARNCRREERILQLFRHFNGSLSKRKESRRRNLNFHLPLMIPLAPHIRMVQDDATYITLQGIYEDHCRKNSMSKDDPVLFTMEKLRALAESKVSSVPDSSTITNANPPQKTADQSIAARLEIYTAIQEKWVNHELVLDYFTQIYPSFAEFWLFRRQFSYQFAALTFMTYILHMHNRYPHKLSISRNTGNIWGSELMSCMAAGKAFFHNPEPVPFRLTPNLQTLMGPLATEGIFSCAIMAIARCLTEPEFELEQQLSLFVRDEMIFWFTSQHRTQMAEQGLRESVGVNSELIVKRTLSLARVPEGTLPANQTVIDLIAKSVNPVNLSQTEVLWMPYL